MTHFLINLLLTRRTFQQTRPKSGTHAPAFESRPHTTEEEVEALVKESAVLAGYLPEIDAAVLVEAVAHGRTAVASVFRQSAASKCVSRP